MTNDILQKIEALSQCDVLMINAHLDTNEYGYCVSGERGISVADLKALVAQLTEGNAVIEHYADANTWEPSDLIGDDIDDAQYANLSRDLYTFDQNGYDKAAAYLEKYVEQGKTDV